MKPKQRAAELRKLMKEHNLTATKVATMLGVTPQAVRTWLRGARNMTEGYLRLLKLLLQG